MRKSKYGQQVLWAFVALGSLTFISGCACQSTFTSPDHAVGSLVDALRSGDQKQLRKILGPSESGLLASGDEVADKNNVQKFLADYDEKHALVPEANGDVSLVVGKQDWAMPIPIVKDPKKDTWRFDTAAGAEEIINRRIGHNELDTIQVCLAIVDAQREYAMEDPDHDGVPAYAAKFKSDPGQKNGLYWETKEDEPPSPLGTLVATAADQGYTAGQHTGSGPRPYLGYCYRILKAQGPGATGGARDYVVDKQLLGGFAVVAYPAEYGSSGIMTFIVNQEGIVYQRDLGDDTKKLAEKMTAYDPDAHWTKVETDDK